ncbi:SHOCT domain-containing protein [Natrialbaceae archaeon A-CW2]
MPDSVLEALAAFTAVATLPIGLLTILYVSLTAGLTVFVIGWLLLVPLFGIGHEFLFSADDSPSERVTNASRQASSDPIEELRNRYARGEIDEAELEARLDTLLEMEAVDIDGSAVQRIKRTLETEVQADSKGTNDTAATQRERLLE